MILIDVQALTPESMDPDKWVEVLRRVHGPDKTYIAPSERLGWLRRLNGPDVWGEVVVHTTRDGFLFWRLCPPRVTVLDDAGKNLGKAQRTLDVAQWAAGLLTNSSKKTDATWLLKAIAKGTHSGEKHQALVASFNDAEANETPLYVTDGTYILVRPDSHPDVAVSASRGTLTASTTIPTSDPPSTVSPISGSTCASGERPTNPARSSASAAVPAASSTPISDEGSSSAVPARTSAPTAAPETAHLPRDTTPTATNTGGTSSGSAPLVTAAFTEVTQLLLEHARSGGKWSWDSETDESGEDDIDAHNPYTDELDSIQISIATHSGYFFPIAMRDTEGALLRDANLDKAEVLRFLRRMYSATYEAEMPGNNLRRVYLHNAKYDYSVMANPQQGVPVSEIYQRWLPMTHDTMLMAGIANEPYAGLKPLAKRRLGRDTIDYKKLTNGKPFSWVPLEHAVVYGCQDADWTLRLAPQLLHRLEELEVTHVYEEDELPLIEYFMRMERRGFLPNREKILTIIAEAEATMQQNETWFRKTAERLHVPLREDFNFGSRDMLAHTLFSPTPEGFGLPVLTRTAKTQRPATDKKTFNKLRASGTSHPALSIYRAWSVAERRRNFFGVPMLAMIQSDGRIRGSWNSVGARTGRTTMQKPNGQQIPPVIRKAIEAEEGGELASLDYSQVELRGQAATFYEPKMVETFNLPRFLPDGSENPEADIHTRTMLELGFEKIFPTIKEARTKAKNFNFGKAFGAGENTLSETAGIPVSQARAFIKLYDERYPDYARNLKAAQAIDEERGYTRTWRGRIRILPIAINERQRQENLRLMSNTPVQGGALDIIKWAMREILPLIREAESWGIHPWNMVHDELDFEREPHVTRTVWIDFLERVQATMQECNPFAGIVPLFVDLEVGPNWGTLRDPSEGQDALEATEE